MDAIIASLQDNPLYLGILIGMVALFLVSLAKQLIKFALVLAIGVAAMFYFVHGQAPEPTGLDKLQEALRDNVPSDLGDRIRETSKGAAESLAAKSKEAAEGIADRIAEATNDTATEKLRDAAESAKETLKAGAEKAGDRVRELSDQVRKDIADTKE